MVDFVVNSASELMNNFPSTVFGNEIVIKEELPNTYFFRNARACRPKLVEKTEFIESRWWLWFEMCVLDENNNHIEVCSDMRGERKIYWPNLSKHDDKKDESFLMLDERCIFGGTIYLHFGHFLIDTLSRIFVFLNVPHYKEYKIIFFLENNNKELFQVGYIKKLFDIFGINRERVVLVHDQDVVIKELIVSDPLIQDSCFASKNIYLYTQNLLNYFGLVGANNNLITYSELNHKKKIAFISRSKISKGTSMIVNADSLDQIATSLGFDVIHPQTIPMEEQVKIFFNYDYICGFPNSFFHWKLFINKTFSSKLIFLVPNIENYIHINFLNLDVSSNFKDVYYLLEATGASNDSSAFTRSAFINEMVFEKCLTNIKVLCSNYEIFIK